MVGTPHSNEQASSGGNDHSANPLRSADHQNFRFPSGAVIHADPINQAFLSALDAALPEYARYRGYEPPKTSNYFGWRRYMRRYLRRGERRKGGAR